MRRGGTICDIDVIDVVRGPRVLVRRGERVQDEHGVRLEVRAGSGQVGEGAVGPEPVVAVVVAHLERARGQDQALAGESLPRASRRAAAQGAASLREGRPSGRGPHPEPMKSRKAWLSGWRDRLEPRAAKDWGPPARRRGSRRTGGCLREKSVP